MLRSGRLVIREKGQSPHEEPCSWHDITLSFYNHCACAYKYIKNYGMLALECFGAKPSEKQAGDMEGAVQAYEEALGIHEPPDATLTRGFSFGACHKSFRADLESARARIPAKCEALNRGGYKHWSRRRVPRLPAMLDPLHRGFADIREAPRHEVLHGRMQGSDSEISIDGSSCRAALV